MRLAERRAERARAGGPAPVVWVVAGLVIAACGEPAAGRPDGVTADEEAAAKDAGPGEPDAALAPLGRVYSSNPVAGELVTVPLSHLLGDPVLEGELARSFGCVAPGPEPTCDGLARRAGADADGNFLYDPEEGSTEDPFAEVQAYYHVTRTLDLFAGFGGAPSDPLRVVVNVPNVAGFVTEEFDAEGGALVLGQFRAAWGLADLDVSYDGDVVAHETVHVAIARLGVTWNTVLPDARGLDHLQNAVKEAIPDYYAAVLTGDPLVGDYLASAFPDGVARDLSADLACPGDLLGEAHLDGRILSGALWRLREAEKVSDLDRIVYEAVGGLSDDSDLATTAAAIVERVRSEWGDGTAGAAESAFAAAGLLDCDRIAPLDLDTWRQGYVAERYSLAAEFAVPAPLQYRVDVPDTATGLRVDFEGVLFHPALGILGPTPLTLLLRRGEPVAYEWTGSSAYTVQADHRIEAAVTATIDASSDPPLSPGAYYLQVASPEPGPLDGVVRYQIRASLL